ncbi:protein asteroid-like [Diorhabda carinulata]|uniref:protein asteroid-like n=1 Tax=Diorhabda carinulata TaxID=1163345 RepID=UPI0025A18BC9|nr:protein asteroid-like [Diorhabda carinulata]
MGIRGLTTFIQNRSHLYLENYELHDTNLVLDGNSIACQLYKWHTSTHDCFGGDYDKFSKTVNEFYDLLAQCNITPHVIFDGGYEKRKVNTVISRMKNKIKSSNLLNSVTETSISVFPLFIRNVFEDVTKERKVNKVRCDFEGDTDIANIASALNCPVLSFDSDYFIFDTLYIPFSTFDMTIKRGKTANKNVYKYICCKIYKVENFLKSFEGLQKTSLPILAVLLGNDYVKRGVFTMFYKNLKIQKCHGNQSDQQKRIKSLLIWLQNETIESALQKVLSRYKKTKRTIILYKIEQAIKGYNCFNSKYMKYLGIDLNIKNKVKIEIDLDKVNNSIEIDDEDEEIPYEEDSSSEEEIFITPNEPDLNLPTEFLQNFRTCIYPPCFMDILVYNQYYCIPQVENNTSNHSHNISFDILSAIYKILTGKTNSLICICRITADQVGKVKIPPCKVNLPKYEEIKTLNKENKYEYFENVLKIDKNYKECLNNFPESWHLLLITINYYLNKSNTNWCIVYSIILSKLIVSHVDEKIGFFYRSSKIFLKKHSQSHITSKLTNHKPDNVKSALEYINKDDCVNCLKKLIYYFEMDDKMIRNHKIFDRALVHSISEFQSCLLHVDYLNTLLGFPLRSISIAECINCTFVYNFTKNLNKRSNLDKYVELLLKDSPSILDSFRLIINKVKEFTITEVAMQPMGRKRRKKKTVKEICEEIEHLDIESDNEVELDPNNKFTLLRIC